jgi:DNA-binding transcriptional regulator LsrR (DeoR family)
MRKNRVKAIDFVRLWMEAVENRQSISWIAKTIGCSDQTVHIMASNLRKQGVVLPNIRRTFVETINVDEMNKLIREKFGEL